MQLGDALDISAVELHWCAERDRAHDRDLVRRVHALDVEGRVGFGIAQRLSLLEHNAEVQALVAHFTQDEIGGAVDDAGDRLDAVGGQPLAQRLDDWNATGHRCFEADHHALGAGCGEDLAAVHRQQRLVRGDHMLAGGDRLHHQRARDAVAADQLDDDVYRRVGDHGAGIADNLDAFDTGLVDQGLGTRGVEVGNHRDRNAAAGAAANLLLVACQHLEGAAADSADTEQADLYGLGFDIKSLRDGRLRRNTL